MLIDRTRRISSLSRPLSLLLLALCAVSCTLSLQACTSTAKPAESSAAKHAPRLLTDQERALQLESFDIVWQTIRDGHFDPNLNGADWDGAKAELRPRVEAATTVDDARAAIDELIAKLKQTHFGLIPGEAYENLAPATSSTDSAASASSSSSSPAASSPAESKTPGVLGLTVRVIDDRALVTRVREDSPAYAAGVRPGWIISAINRAPVERSLKTTTLAAGSPALGLALVARALESRLDGPVDSAVNVTFIDDRDQPISLDLKRIPPRGSPATVANLPTMFVEYNSRRLPENVGYISLSIFLDPVKVNPFFDAAIAEFADTDGIVLDLRGNPGGLGIMAIGIGGYFVDERNQKLGTMKTRQASLNFVLNPRATPYLKPLAVLVDECSLSTSEILAGGLQDLKRARVFGSRTGGAALPSVIKKLPSGDALQYAMADYVSASGRTLEGQGVTPDEAVLPSRPALLAGQDPALDAAVRWIRSQSQR